MLKDEIDLMQKHQVPDKSGAALLHKTKSARWQGKKSKMASHTENMDFYSSDDDAYFIPPSQPPNAQFLLTQIEKKREENEESPSEDEFSLCK